MTPEETIKESIHFYPSIFPNRAWVLHHLFFVIGNGYEWIDGELVDIDDRSLENPFKLPFFSFEYGFINHYSVLQQGFKEKTFNQETGVLDNESLNTLIKGLLENNLTRLAVKLGEIITIHWKIDELCQTLDFPIGGLYPPIINIAYAFKYPKDITPEWDLLRLEAINFFKPLYQQRYPEFIFPS